MNDHDQGADETVQTILASEDVAEIVEVADGGAEPMDEDEDIEDTTNAGL